jgi:N-acetylmuramoyl-L-alanine amidase
VALSGKTESQINLEIALRTDALCGLLGIRTKLLRTEDVSLADADAGSLREKKRSDLKNRAELVNSLPGARLLSIHQNYFEGASPHGAQVFYHGDEESHAWAEALQERLRTCVDPDNTRTAVPVPEFVYLMRHVDCPAVLVECGFLSNPEENQRLESSDYQKKLAAVLAASCLEQEPDGKA